MKAKYIISTIFLCFCVVAIFIGNWLDRVPVNAQEKLEYPVYKPVNVYPVNLYPQNWQHIYPTWISPVSPAEMIQNPTDGDSLIILFEPSSNDSIKLFFHYDSTGTIDSISVNLSYYRIFCSDSTVSFKIIYK